MYVFDLPEGAFLEVLGHRLRHEGSGLFSCADNDRPQVIEGLIKEGTQKARCLETRHMPDMQWPTELAVWFCNPPA